MTQNKKFKQRVRAWARAHSVSYTTALQHFLKESGEPNRDADFAQKVEPGEGRIPKDPVASLAQLLERGQLTREQIRTAAALGSPGARQVLSPEEIANVQAPRRPWLLRQGYRAAHRLGIRRRSPEQTELIDWVMGIRELGEPSTIEAARCAVRACGADWGRVSEALDSLWEIEREPNAEDLGVRLEQLIEKVSSEISPDLVREHVRRGLVAWGTGQEVPREKHSFAEFPAKETRAAVGRPRSSLGEGPILLLSHRIIEDAFSRGNTEVVFSLAGPRSLNSLPALDRPQRDTLSALQAIRQEGLAAKVTYDVEERMRFPVKALPHLLARLRFMAGLDPVSRSRDQGSFTYRHRDRTLRVTARFAAVDESEEQACLTLEQLSGPPVEPHPPRTPDPEEERRDNELEAARYVNERAEELLDQPDLTSGKLQRVKAIHSQSKARLDPLEEEEKREYERVLAEAEELLAKHRPENGSSDS